MSLRRPLGSVFVASLVLAACGDDDPGRDTVVASLTDEAPARYAALAGQAQALVDSIDDLCEDPTGDPSAAASAVDEVRQGWLALGPFWFGPVEDRNSRFDIDWEVRPEEIDELAASDAAVDAASLGEVVGADQRGLGAVDHLLSTPLDDRRCEYALGSATLVAEEIDILADEWSTFGSAAAADIDTANDTLADIISQSLFAIAMVPDAADGESAAAGLAGARWALIGDESIAPGNGISDLLDDDLVERLADGFDSALAAPNEQFTMALATTIRTDVAGALGLSVAFSDADGDG